MCGILGIFSPHLLPAATVRQARASLASIAHRGPDGEGLVCGHPEGVANADEEPFSWILGHRRLAILDLSGNGAQPMASHDGRFWITYNGEVYNYLELRGELEAEGVRFRSHTDTEVILEAYRKWGTRCVERFVGMFAFVLLDLEARVAFAARDRLGIKPLYLWQNGTITYTVSEPKQLLAFPAFRPVLHAPAMVDFLLDGVVGHEPDTSFFAGVVPLPPGTTLAWPLAAVPDPADAQPYWRLPEERHDCGWEEACHTTGALLRDAVRLRLRSDVPVGSCLSGGIDSSAIVGIAARECNHGMHTFSSCFAEAAFDEQMYMDAVNAHCGTTAVKVFPDAERLVGEIDILAWHQDEPFGSLSMYSQWWMRAAREAGVPVLLDGQGGDEALCGYAKYTYFHLQNLIRQFRWGAALRWGVPALVCGDRSLLKFRAGMRYLPGWLRRAVAAPSLSLRPPLSQVARRVWAERSAGRTSILQRQTDDLRHWSLPVLLRYEDRNSMAFSVESRVPFVDHRFVEHCLRLPDAHFFRRGMTKRVVVDALGETLPDAVRARKTKMGFESAQSLWLRGEVGAMLEARVASCRALGALLDTAPILAAFRAYRRDPAQRGDDLLFRVASVALWLDRFSVQPE